MRFCRLSYSVFLLFLFGPRLWAAPDTPLFDRPPTGEIFYFLMTDRFADGDPLNNRGLESSAPGTKDTKEAVLRHGYEPTLDTFYHGGDFAGIIQKLDYLQGLGITSIWLSPIFKNKPTQPGASPLGVTSGYHGYWPMDFTAVDPHLGSEDDFKRLIDAAHQRGIKVFIDAIVNHTADLISYRECGECPYRSKSEYPYSSTRKGRKLNPNFVDGDFSASNFARLKNPDFAYTPFISDPKLRKKPEWLNNPIYYHNRGNSTFSGENSELGDFYGLDDLFTENPQVLNGMIAIYSDWIKKYKFDGLRVDTVKHVNIEFWQEFVPALRTAAQSAGIKNFFIFGEVFSADPVELSRYTRLGKMDSVLDFSFQAAVKDVFANGQDPERLHSALEMDDLHRLGSSPQQMMTFISNHDIGRLAYFMKQTFKDASEEEILRRLTLAHAYLYFARGIPVLYYGDEQGLVGSGGDTGAREDMFATQSVGYKELKPLYGKAGVAHYDVQHPMYTALKAMGAVLKENPALREGDYIPLRNLGKDVFAFRRSVYGDANEHVLIFNMNAQNPQTLEWSKPGFNQLYPTKEKLSSSLSVPPLSFVLIKGPKGKEKQTNTRKTFEFKDLLDGERKSGLFFAEVNIPEGLEAKVSFARKAEAKEAYQSLYVDSSPPYRAYIDASKVVDGRELWIKADIEVLGQKTQKIERRLIIDSRSPLVTLHYENGNKRSEAYTISKNGRITAPQALAQAARFSFPWSLDEDSYLLVFTSKGSSALDQPLYLSYRDHILPHIKKGADGAPRLDIFVNNRHDITFDKLLASGSDLPETFSDSDNTGEKPPLGEQEIFVRGGMNTWEPKDTMVYQGNFTYAAPVQLSPGTVEFKFADKNWQAGLNFGAPVTKSGLSASGGSTNLSFTVPNGAGGRYLFQLITRGDTKDRQPLNLVRIAPATP